jgi:SAM-dependent methyltransferase
MDQN